MTCTVWLCTCGRWYARRLTRYHVRAGYNSTCFFIKTWTICNMCWGHFAQICEKTYVISYFYISNILFLADGWQFMGEIIRSVCFVWEDVIFTLIKDQRIRATATIQLKQLWWDITLFDRANKLIDLQLQLMKFITNREGQRSQIFTCFTPRRYLTFSRSLYMYI